MNALSPSPAADPKFLLYGKLAELGYGDQLRELPEYPTDKHFAHFSLELGSGLDSDNRNHLSRNEIHARLLIAQHISDVAIRDRMIDLLQERLVPDSEITHGTSQRLEPIDAQIGRGCCDGREF